MNELKQALKNEKRLPKTKITLFVLLIVGLITTAFFLFWLFGILILLIIGALIALILNEVKYIQLLDRISSVSHKNRIEILELFDREISLLKGTVGAERTEMDIHAVNATNEHKAMLAANRNKLALEKKLGRLYHLRAIVEKHAQVVDDNYII